MCKMALICKSGFKVGLRLGLGLGLAFRHCKDKGRIFTDKDQLQISSYTL